MEYLVVLAIGLAGGYLLARQIAARSAPPPGRDRSTTEADQALANAVERSLQAVDMGILVFDGRGQRIYANPAAEFLRFTRPARALVNGEIGDTVAQIRREQTVAPSGKGTIEREIELYGPPKTVLSIRVLPSPSESGLGAVVIVQDVTGAKRLEEVRRSFVANVSHELRTPVGAIAVLAETLSVTDDPATIARLGDRISSSAHRLGEMIEDLLELSRTESGSVPEPALLRVGDLVGAAVANLEESATTVGTNVIVEVNPDDLSVSGDRRQLRSAIQNLLDNAIKYTEKGGEVRITGEAKGEWAVLRIVDTGIGIPEADLDRIFERFYRVDAARRRETGGTGLGLSIVRHVILNHAGDISVTSIEGEGTTFTIELPLADPEPVRTAESPQEGSVVG